MATSSRGKTRASPRQPAHASHGGGHTSSGGASQAGDGKGAPVAAACVREEEEERCRCYTRRSAWVGQRRGAAGPARAGPRHGMAATHCHGREGSTPKLGQNRWPLTVGRYEARMSRLTSPSPRWRSPGATSHGRGRTGNTALRRWRRGGLRRGKAVHGSRQAVATAKSYRRGRGSATGYSSSAESRGSCALAREGRRLQAQPWWMPSSAEQVEIGADMGREAWHEKLRQAPPVVAIKPAYTAMGA